MGVLATWLVHRAVSVPIVGVGGVSRGTDAVQYLLAGASLVGMGTAALRDPRAPERVVRELEQWCRAHDVRAVRDLTGALEWQYMKPRAIVALDVPNAQKWKRCSAASARAPTS